MNAIRICFVFLASIQLCSLSTLLANQHSEEKKLRALLQADVERMLADEPKHVLNYYESIEKAREAHKEDPIWKMMPMGGLVYHPVMAAQFGEINLHGADLPLSEKTKSFIEGDRSRALDLAIELSQADFSGAARLAAEIVKQYRDDLNKDQWRKIVDGRRYVIRHRDKYPAGLDTWADGFSHIPFGYIIFKQSEARCLDSQTSYLVDGVPKYPNSTHGLGWRSDLGYVGFEKLSVGKHQIQLKTSYKFKLGGIEFIGLNESPKIEIEILPADTPDHLATAVDDKLIEEVESAIVVGDEKDGREFTYSKPVAGKKFQPYAKIWVPAIKVASPVSVSLQMKPEIYIEGEDNPLTRQVLRVPPGTTAKRVLENWVGDQRLATLLKEKADADGKLKAKVILRPSRSHALSDPTVDSYYPHTIEREIEFRWRSVD